MSRLCVTIRYRFELITFGIWQGLFDQPDCGSFIDIELTEVRLQNSGNLTAQRGRNRRLLSDAEPAFLSRSWVTLAKVWASLGSPKGPELGVLNASTISLIHWGRIVPLRCTSWRPNLEHLRIWPDLEIGSMKMWLSWDEVIKVGPNPIWPLPLWKGQFGDTHTHIKNAVWWRSQRWAWFILKPGSTKDGWPANHQKLGDRPGTESLSALWWNRPSPCFDLTLLSSCIGERINFSQDSCPCRMPMANNEEGTIDWFHHG